MTTLYLQRIEISNFRAYGDTFALSLPGPGVTILTGPDGLGKSTFFESIEWALTGRVRRQGVARREEDVPVAQYGVSLEFVSGQGERSRIERRAVRQQENGEQFAEVLSPTQQQLIDLLRAGSWSNEISDIGEYLRLTHLRGPAGTAKIDLIARRLGPETTRAFAERVRQLEIEKDLAQQALRNWHELLSRRARSVQLAAAGGGLPAEVIIEKAIAIAAALKAAHGVEPVLEGAPPPAELLPRLLQAIEQAVTVLMERKRVLSQAEETLSAWQQINAAAAEAKAQYVASQATLVSLQNQLQAILGVDERRRDAEFRRDTLLQLSAARKKIAQALTQKAQLTGQIDRQVQETWMLQSYLHNTAKTLRQIADLDSRIRSLLLAKQEIERCQQAYDEWVRHQAGQETIQSSPMLAGVAWEQIPSHLTEVSRRTQSELEIAQSARDQLPDPERLNEHKADMQARINEASSTIKQKHEVVAQVEQELLAAQALQQQHPELLSALGTLPADEAKVLEEAARAVEQLVHHERQLVQSEEPFPSVLLKLNEEITKAQAASAQKASETQELEHQIASLQQRWLELGLPGLPDPVALSELRNEMAEQESKLQEFREQQKQLADAWLAWQREEELRQAEFEINEQARRESPPSVDAVEERLRAALAIGVDNYNRGLEAQRIASVAAELAQEAHHAYSEKVLRPLEALAQRFLLAISASPELSLDADALARHARGQLQVDIQGATPAAFHPSEGYGASLGVASLLSMSTAYRWSRWPALLLDAPLRHHDLIHPAAFIEVLRNLVRDQKYQVVFSTRDEKLAEDMRRKMVVAGIECVTCRYSGLGPTGVLYNTA